MFEPLVNVLERICVEVYSMVNSKIYIPHEKSSLRSSLIFKKYLVYFKFFIWLHLFGFCCYCFTCRHSGSSIIEACELFQFQHADS